MNDLFPVPAEELANLLDKAGAGEIPEARWPGELLAMVAVVADTWVRHGSASDLAAERAREAVAAIAWRLGGRQIYLPSGESMERAVQDAALWAEYNYRPNDVERLRIKYKLATEREVYRIIERQRELWQAKVQPRLAGV